ncbi:MAG: UDP-3-O-(3-hydroxymyristoyl)glucosamine N-acyltransferase [Cyanobacteria bacterium P01_C01_bin.89]
MKFTALVEKLRAIAGDGISDCSEENPEIDAIGALDEAIAGQLTYVENAAKAKGLATTAASAVIIPADESAKKLARDRGLAWITSPAPKLLFAQAVPLFYQPFHPAPGIHPTAVIDPAATIGKDVAIAANSVIQGNAIIGDGAKIHANVTVYPGSVIGAGTVLHSGCVIEERSHLGANCVIHSGAVIGGEGFGFVPTATGWVKLEQTGQVVLEDSVDIGCNTTVDRPALGETRVGSNTKIDNMVHIGHGCVIGRNCAIAAQVGLAGGVELGDGVILAGQVGIANRLKLAKGTIVSSKSGVTRSASKPGQVLSGFPAVSNKEWLKTSAIIRRLPEMYQTLKQIRKHLNL